MLAEVCGNKYAAQFNHSLPSEMEKSFSKLSGDGPRFAVAKDAPIDLDDGNHLGGCAAQEALFSRVQVLASERHFLHGDCCLSGQLDNGPASDALENAGIQRRRAELALLNDKNVVAAALGYLALMIEHDAFEAAGANSFQLGQDVIEIIQRFDARAQRGGMIADRGNGADIEPAFAQLARIERDIINDDDDLRIGALAWIQT